MSFDLPSNRAYDEAQRDHKFELFGVKIARILFLFIGVALLGVIIANTDFQGALQLVSTVGGGVALLLLLFF